MVRADLRHLKLQGLLRVAKELFYDRAELINYDIESSQTEALRELADELRAAGADVNLRPSMSTWLKAARTGLLPNAPW